MLAAVFFTVSYVKKEELKYYDLKELKNSGVLKGILAVLLLLVLIFLVGTAFIISGDKCEKILSSL